MHYAIESVVGSDHVLPGQGGKKNNQDAYTAVEHDHGIVAVLCDGCGSRPHTDVGATIGARIIAGEVLRQVNHTAGVSLNWPGITRATLNELRKIAQTLTGKTESSVPEFEQVVADYLLFTALVVVTYDDQVVIAACGDGVFAIDGKTTYMDPPLATLNAPPYLGYALLQKTGYHTDELKKHLALVPVAEVSLGSVQKGIVVGTDGVESLIGDESIYHPGLMKEGALRSWLDSQATERFVNGAFAFGKCGDDTTILILRSNEAQMRLEAERNEVAELRGRFDATMSELATLRTDFQDLERENDRLEASLKRSREDIEVAKRSTESVRQVREVAERKAAEDIKRLMDEVTRLRNRLADKFVASDDTWMVRVLQTVGMDIVSYIPPPAPPPTQKVNPPQSGTPPKVSQK